MTKQSKITIIIPTFNRTEEVIYNLKLLAEISDSIKLDLPIIIGDDGSKISHKEAIVNYINSSNQSIQYYYNDNNLGVEGNELKLVSKVTTEYALLLGEDDYLNAKLVSKIIRYVEEGIVTAIIPNFYGVNKNGEQIRTPRYQIKKDRYINQGDVKYFCYASQMSGLTFKVKDVFDEYQRRGIKGNSYPQFFFIAYNLENGPGVHITEDPFKNTVLKKKQFDYSVDNLLIDLLHIVNALRLDEKAKRDVTKFVLKENVIRYGNKYTWTHPSKLIQKVKNYDESIDEWTKNEVIFSFFLSYLKAPLIIARHFYVRRHFWKNKVL